MIDARAFGRSRSRGPATRSSSRRLSFFFRDRDRLAELASQHRLPAMLTQRRNCRGRRPDHLRHEHSRDVSARSPTMSARSSRAPSRPICRSSSRPRSSWSSISRPPRRSASPSRHRSSPAPTRSSNETPRVDAPAGRRDDGGARPPRAAEGDAGDRLPRQRLARPECTVCGRVPPGTERNRLCRGTKCGDRIPLGGGPL